MSEVEDELFGQSKEEKKKTRREKHEEKRKREKREEKRKREKREENVEGKSCKWICRASKTKMSI